VGGLLDLWTGVFHAEGLLADEGHHVVAIPSAFTGYVWLHAILSNAPLSYPVSHFVSIDWMSYGQDHRTNLAMAPTPSNWKTYRSKMVDLLKSGGNPAVVEHADSSLGLADEMLISKGFGFVRDSILRLGHPVEAMENAARQGNHKKGTQFLYVGSANQHINGVSQLDLGQNFMFAELEEPAKLANAVLSFVSNTH
jgi:hypothetical protein